MTKRPDGALEHDVMTVLWAHGAPMLPGEVQSALGSKLAYTSVATVLGRLHTKGMVTRSPDGRAFRYEAAVGEAQLAARRIGDVLSSVSDREAVLSGFVESLSRRDAKMLRGFLDGPDR